MSNLPKIGIDIGTASIKLVELVPTGGHKWKMQAFASSPALPGGILGNKNNLPAYSQMVAKIVKDSGMKVKRVVASLPEEQVSSHVVEMPLMSDNEIQQALQWQVEQYIPIPSDKAVWSYEVIKKDVSGGDMEILLVAAAKSLVGAYTQVLEQAGLEVVALETELMAIARSEAMENFPLSLIVDIGLRSTDVGIVRSGQLVFARTIPTAAEAMTRAIETGLGVDTIQAEQYKNTYGFSADKLEGKLAGVLKPVLNIIAGEIKKTMDFYTSKHGGENVRVITLSGGAAMLPEIISNMSGMLGIEVVVANPFAKIVLDENQTKQLSTSGPLFSVATGLAMREI